MKPSCSIIIRAYNEEKHLGRLLEGILQQTVRDVEIILVDSGSTDGTLQVAARYPVKIVQIRPQEFTFGRSLNRGITAAQGDWLVFASAHVYPVYPDWLERLLEPLQDTQMALSYGMQRGTDSTKFSEHQIFARWFPDQSQLRQDHPFCNNANAAIQRKFWDRHAYDETLPGLEDLAWARWAFEQGLGIAYVPAAQVIHVHNETPRGVYNRYRREGMAFKQIYPQEHFNLVDFVRLFTGNAFSDLRCAAQQGCLRHKAAEIFWFRWQQFWGTYQGYRRSGPLTWQLKQAFYYPNQTLPTMEEPVRNVTPIEYKDHIP